MVRKIDIKDKELGSEVRVGIVAARWNSMVTDPMLKGALEVLRGKGLADDQITVVRCPGSYEIPLACQNLLDHLNLDGVVAIGAIIRGETPHFNYVCDAVNRGISELNLSYGRPVAFGVLTTDTMNQAMERAGNEYGNKGAEAALAMCEMITLKKTLKDYEG
ncbi:MAG: 6,7-dimethyl-8-ribityllumazine synthase [Balneolaceae bacterium]